MKKLLIILAIAMIPMFIACKKNREFKKEDGTTSEDNRNVQGETDQAINDANNVVSSVSNINGGSYDGKSINSMLTNGEVCGATIDTTLKTQGIVTINFDGVTVCNNRKRAGSIKLTLKEFLSGKRWIDPGAVLEVVYNDYKVTRASDGKSIKLNGLFNLTNVSGGNLILLYFGIAPNQTNLIHRAEGTNISVTFDDTKTAIWNISRQATYTKSMNGNTVVFTCTAEGIGSYNGISNLENWGTTREGDAFTSQVTEPVVWNTTCGAHAPVTGKLTIKVDSKEFELITIIGVDESGNPVPVTVNNCPYGLKVIWTYKNKTESKIIPYK
jgi:hypothetical protein